MARHWPDTSVGVSGRVSVDTGVGVSRCRDSVGVVSGSGVEVSSQGSTANTQGLTHGSKGLWRGVGEPALRGLYNALASSSLRHHLFREKRSARLREYLGQIFSRSSTKGLAKRSSFFSPGAFFQQGPQLSNKSRSAPRSGKAATLPTLQMESRHAASARLTGFRHRWTARQAQQVRPFM